VNTRDKNDYVCAPLGVEDSQEQADFAENMWSNS